MKFNNFLGFFLKGFEGEFLSMLQKIKKKKRNMLKGRVSVQPLGSTKN